VGASNLPQSICSASASAASNTSRGSAKTPRFCKGIRTQSAIPPSRQISRWHAKKSRPRSDNEPRIADRQCNICVEFAPKLGAPQTIQSPIPPRLERRRGVGIATAQTYLGNVAAPLL
jgi:hypothetical protein